MKNVFINCDNETQDILFITNEAKLMKEIHVKDHFTKKNIFCNSESKFTLYSKVLEDFSLIVFDTRHEEEIVDFELFYKHTVDMNIDIPIILIGNNLNKKHLHNEYTKIFSFLPSSTPSDLILLNISLCQKFINSKKRLDFENGLIFQFNIKALTYNNEIIKFTKAERMIIELLIKNLNSIVSYEELKDYLWENKRFTKDTLRNKIRHIREKTDRNFIKNISNQGYMIKDI